MAYRPGYRFQVGSTRGHKGDEVKTRIYLQRYKDRGPEAEPLAYLEDGDTVECLVYKEGAFVVFVERTGHVGWLG